MYERCVTIMAVLLLTAVHTSFCTDIPWVSVGSGMKIVSMGGAGIWGVDDHNFNYYRLGTYRSQGSTGSWWIFVWGYLKQVDVGRDVVWGVSFQNNVFYRKGIFVKIPQGYKWVQVDGRMKYVSVSERNHVWAINAYNYIYIRKGASTNNLRGNTWKKIPGSLKQISVGYSGVWGVDRNNNIFYRTGTYGDMGYEGTDWEKVRQVPGKAKYVTSGLERVIVVSCYDVLYTRVGISAKNPTGTYWGLYTSNHIFRR